MKRCYVCGKRIWFFPVEIVVKLPDKTVTMPAYPDADAEAIEIPISLADAFHLWVHEGCLGKLEIDILLSEEEHEENKH